MKQKITKTGLFLVGLIAALWLGVGLAASSATLSAQDTQTQNAKVMAEFEGRVKEYSRLRERLEETLPKLPKDATAEQIKAHKLNFEGVVREARENAKQGDIFTPEAANLIRATIRETFKGKKLEEVRREIMEAETAGVVMRVNYTYPESKELTQVPPTLLLKLPQLPKQVKYRFVGKNLLLVDRENGLIVDYMLNAWP